MTKLVAALWVVVFAAGGCGFSAGDGVDAGSVPGDATRDAPPPETPLVRFVSVSPSVTMVRPGTYGFRVTAVLRNDAAFEVSAVRAGLTFGARGGELRFRDADAREGQRASAATSIAAGGELSLEFVVDALAWAAAPGAIEVNAAATVDANGEQLSATPLADPATIAVPAGNPAIVVTSAADSIGGGALTLRDAMLLAGTRPGLDRIVFNPVVFPPATPAAIALDPALGQLPQVDGDLVIDAHDAGVELVASAAWEQPSGRFVIRQTAGVLVLHGVGFRNTAYGYPADDVSGENCTGGPRQGAAIRVDGGTLILDSNRFADPDVPERNCYANLVRLEGGRNHRIVGNRWTSLVMDALYVRGPAVEVVDNVLDAGGSPGATDDGMVFDMLDGITTWVIGNLVVDSEAAGLFTRGSGTGTLYLVNNTFARSATLSGLSRSGTRSVVLRNNLWLDNAPNALDLGVGAGAGTGADLAYETTVGGGLCRDDCPAAEIAEPTMLAPGSAGVANASGSSRADFTPQAGSPLLDSGLDWIDRNGSAPGRFSGRGPDRGAVERP